MILRRLRGLLATTVGGALVGFAAATLLAIIGWLIPGNATVSPQFFGAIIVVPAVLGAILGAASGAAFGVLLMLAERGRRIADLRGWRVALWAAVASAAAVGITGSTWGVVALGSAIGAGVGGVASFLAKRAPERMMSEGELSAHSIEERLTTDL